MKISAGLDEVGTGALAGPFISVMAVFRESDFKLLPSGVRDSKKTTENQRDMMFFPLIHLAYDIGVGWAWPWEIDDDYTAALQLSYKRAIEGINPSRAPEVLIVDGVNHVSAWPGKQVVEPKADLNHWQVSAASIIAKVYRDTVMKEYSLRFPKYNFDVNKGYCTDDHVKAIRDHGLMIDLNNKEKYIHRQRYCRKLVKK